MKKIHSQRVIFFSLLSLIFFATALVPFMYRGGFIGLSEEPAEAITIAILMTAAFAVNSLCLKEYWRLHRYQVNLEDRLQDTFKYIGSVNLQMEEMRQAFSNIKKYPENKKDIRAVFSYFGEKILGMINADWVIIRVVDMMTQRTIREDRYARNKQTVDCGKIENSELLSGRCKDERYTIIKTEQDNISFKTFCVIPTKLANRDQEFFIRSIINQLEMLYLVFSSLNKNGLGNRLEAPMAESEPVTRDNNNK
ncbi:MAG: hypothetical protein ACM3PZ_00380 [Bacillota bacterium]